MNLLSCEMSETDYNGLQSSDNSNCVHSSLHDDMDDVSSSMEDVSMESKMAMLSNQQKVARVSRSVNDYRTVQALKLALSVENAQQRLLNSSLPINISSVVKQPQQSDHGMKRSWATISTEIIPTNPPDNVNCQTAVTAEARQQQESEEKKSEVTDKFLDEINTSNKRLKDQIDPHNNNDTLLQQVYRKVEEWNQVTSSAIPDTVITMVPGASTSMAMQQSDSAEYDINNDTDWKIPDAKSEFVEQSVEHEIKRLLVLKSYEVLDRRHDIDQVATFNRLSAMAGRHFQMSFAFVTIMDLGRLYFLGSHVAPGLFPDDVTQSFQPIPRRTSFCSFGILTKNDDDVFIIPDTTKDTRTSSNPFTLDYPYVRFYASAPLVCPEGFRLGTFALLDTKPRPNGLTDEERAMLRDFSKMAIDYLVAHKNIHWQKKQVESASQMLASAANDLLTPLTGVQLSLSLLRQEMLPNTSTDNGAGTSSGKIDGTGHHKDVASAREVCETPRTSPTSTPTCPTKTSRSKEFLNTATTCAALMGEICETLRSRTNKNDVTCNHPETITVPTKAPSTQEQLSAMMNPRAKTDEKVAFVPNGRRVNTSKTNEMGHTAAASKSICSIDKLVQRLKAVMEAVPKQVPVVIKVDPAVPNNVFADELPIFRAALNLLSASCDRTRIGNISLTVSICKETDTEFLGTSEELLFTCVDSGPSVGHYDSGDETDGTNDIVSDGGKTAQKTSQSVLLQSFGKSTLSSVAALVRSVGGDFGVMSLDGDSKGLWKSLSGSFETVNSATRMLPVAPTTKFWFKIPLFVPDEHEMTVNSTSNHPDPSNGETRNQNSMSKNNPPTKVPRQSHSLLQAKSALVIDDSIVIRKTLGRALAGLGYQTVQAGDGLVGLNHMKAAIFHIVLCDFLMPVMDGMDCVREYRKWEAENRSGFRQYIVGMSAHASKKDAERAIGIGMNLSLSKPIFLKTLKDLTEEADLRMLTSVQSPQAIVNVSETISDAKQSSIQTCEAVGTAKYNCLIGGLSDVASRLEKSAKENEFVPFLAANYQDFTKRIKARNWVVVLIDQDLLQTEEGLICIAEFRHWEKINRVHRQKNVYMVRRKEVQDGVMSNPLAMINIPAGIDGVLKQSEVPGILSEILHRAKENRPFAADDIVTST